MLQRILPLLLMVFFLSSMAVYAQWSSDPAVNNPIVRAINNQNGQQIISDGKGGAIICWHDERFQSNSFDIYAQRIDKDGYLRWPENGVVISRAVFSQLKPNMISDGQGGAIIAWEDTRAGDNDIYAQRIDSTGKVLWAEDGIVVVDGQYNQSNPRMCADGNGGVIVSYVGAGSGPGTHVYAMRLDADGNRLWADPVPISTAMRLQTANTIAPDGEGGAYIAYAHLTQSNYDVYAQRVDSNGTVYWKKNGIAFASGSGSEDTPFIVFDGVRNAFLSYLNYGSGSIATLHVLTIRPDGTSKGAVRVTSTTGGQSEAHLANIEPGLLGIVWEDGRVAGKTRVYAQIIDTTGQVFLQTDGLAVSDRTGAQAGPNVVSDGEGGIIICWEDRTRGLLNTDIYAQRISSAGSLMWSDAGVPVCTANNPKQFSHLINDGDGGAIIVWEDFRASMGNLDIFASRVLSDGTFPISPPQLSLSAVSVAFGDVALSSSAKKEITLNNIGGVPLIINSVTSSDLQFSLTTQDNTIPPSGKITGDVRFTPASKNSFTAYLVIESNSITSPDTITVTGRGTGAADIETDKTMLDFGIVNIGETHSLKLSITNPGNDTLSITEMTTSNSVFTVEIESNVVLPGDSFDNTVYFKPTAVGPISGELTILSNALTSPTVINLSGSGVGEGRMEIEHSSISFGEVFVGESKDTTISVTNTGNDTLRIHSVMAADPSFTLGDPMPDANIPPAASVIVTLRFTPADAGPISSFFIAESNAASGMDTVFVDGIGIIAPAVVLSPTKLSFGAVLIDTLKELTLTINNPGTQDLVISSITSTNPVFSVSTGQFAVSGGESFSETARFEPTEKGVVEGLLIIVSNAVSSPDTILVDGEGVDVLSSLHFDAAPGTFALHQNYPNPFNPATAIEFSIPKKGELRLGVYDHRGREIAVLAEGLYDAGSYVCNFDASDLPSGLYVYRLSFSGSTIERKMLLLR